jgi:hypothetical protein
LYSKLGCAGALTSAGKNAHTNARDAPTAPRSNISALRLTIKQILLSVLLERIPLLKAHLRDFLDCYLVLYTSPTLYYMFQRHKTIAKKITEI